MSLEVEPLSGAALGAALPDLARLRIAVFREWPYLYDGDEAYERRYLAGYDAPGAILVAARDGDRIVGAATGMPLARHEDGARLAGLPVPAGAVFYCAESVLLPEHRGRGAGHRFFDLREAHARALGLTHSVFCAVARPDDHPARPEGARSLAPFWRGRGYEPVEGAGLTIAWRDVGEARETPHRLDAWMRAL